MSKDSKYIYLDVSFLGVTFKEVFLLFRWMQNEKENTDDRLTKVGLRIKQLRKAKGYSSYEKFAIENDISRMQYWRYEKGGEDMRISSLFKIVDALGISMQEFFSEGFDK